MTNSFANKLFNLFKNVLKLKADKIYLITMYNDAKKICEENLHHGILK